MLRTIAADLRHLAAIHIGALLDDPWFIGTMTAGQAARLLRIGVQKTVAAFAGHGRRPFVWCYNSLLANLLHLFLAFRDEGAEVGERIGLS